MRANPLCPCILLFLMLIAACGGGGSGSGGNDNPEPVDDALTGLLIYSAVAGVAYETPTHRGVTGAGGEFRYEAGETVRFSIGGTPLGEVAGQERITLFDLAHSPAIIGTAAITRVLLRPQDPFQRVINIAVLLQSLDDDGDPGNGIRITPQVSALLQEVNLDVAQRWDAFARQFLLRHALGQANTRGLFSKPHGIAGQAPALKHLYATLDINPGIFGVTLNEADYYGDGTVDYASTRRYDENGNTVWSQFPGNPRIGSPPSIGTVSYNANCRPIRGESDWYADGTVDSVLSYQYDDYGQLVRVEGASDTDVSVTTYQYDADGNKTRQQTDNNGVATYIEIFQYDASGRETRYQRDQDGDGVPEETRLAEFDSRGNQTLVGFDYDADGIAEFQTVWQYHYGADGRLLQVDLDQNRDGTIESTELNQYDADGKLMSRESRSYDGDDGVLIAINSTHFDPRGNLTRYWVDRDADGSIDVSEVYHYDANDNLTRTESDNDGNGTPDFIVNKFYDDVGILMQVEGGYDEDGDGVIDKVSFNEQYDANGSAVRREEIDHIGGRGRWLVIYRLEYEATGWCYLFPQ